MTRLLVVVLITLASQGCGASEVRLSDTRYPGERSVARRFFAADLQEARRGPTSDSGETEIEVGVVDLDHDGRDEIIVRLFQPYFCGAHGCSLNILRYSDGKWTNIGDFIGESLVLVQNQVVNGFRTIKLGKDGHEFSLKDGKYQ